MAITMEEDSADDVLGPRDSEGDLEGAREEMDRAGET